MLIVRNNRRTFRIVAALVACLHAYFGLIAAGLHSHRSVRPAVPPLPVCTCVEAGCDCLVAADPVAPDPHHCPVCAFFGTLLAPVPPFPTLVQFAPRVHPALPPTPESKMAGVFTHRSSSRAPPVT